VIRIVGWSWSSWIGPSALIMMMSPIRLTPPQFVAPARTGWPIGSAARSPILAVDRASVDHPDHLAITIHPITIHQANHHPRSSRPGFIRSLAGDLPILLGHDHDPQWLDATTALSATSISKVAPHQ
jgi:hypothetical protein